MQKQNKFQRHAQRNAYLGREKAEGDREIGRRRETLPPPPPSFSKLTATHL